MDKLYIFQKHPVRNHGELYYYEVYFEWYFEVAYEVLKNRKDDEIAQLVWDIDKLIITSNDEYRNFSDQESILKDPSSLYPSRVHVVQLQHYMSKGIDIGKISSLKNITWAECFAGALLGHAIFALDAELKLKDTGQFKKNEVSEFFYDLGEYMGHFSTSCMEILSVLYMMPDYDGDSLSRSALHKKKKNEAINAANVRHEPGNNIKNIYIKWYEENANNGTFKNKDNAANKFHHQLSENDKEIISSPETLKTALRDHLRNK
jgi:hypothetical protein